MKNVDVERCVEQALKRANLTPYHALNTLWWWPLLQIIGIERLFRW